jgi:hypothetical protein
MGPRIQDVPCNALITSGDWVAKILYADDITNRLCPCQCVNEHINLVWSGQVSQTLEEGVLRSSIMSAPTQEKVESKGVSPSSSQKDHSSTFSTDGDVAMRHVWRKLDIHLLPLTSLLYLLCFL